MYLDVPFWFIDKRWHGLNKLQNLIHVITAWFDSVPKHIFGVLNASNNPFRTNELTLNYFAIIHGVE